MKKIILKIFLTVIGVLTLSACLLDDTVTDFGKGPIVVQFPAKEASQNFLQDESNKVYDYKVPIEYFGKNGLPLDEDVTVVVEVDDSKEDYAKEGVEFSIPNKKVVIPAGSNRDSLLVKVNSKVLDSSNPKEMVLKIVESSQTPSDSKNLTKITLQAICPSALQGDYVYTTGRKRDVTIEATGAGTYTVSADDAFNSEYSFNISDVCGKLKVTGGFLQDNYNIAVSGTGSVDKATGTITIIYTADGYLSNKEMVLVKK